MFILFEVACSPQTILAVLVMSTFLPIFRRLHMVLTSIRIVGTITRVGSKAVGGLKVGQIAGVGSQIGCKLAPSHAPSSPLSLHNSDTIN